MASETVSMSKLYKWVNYDKQAKTPPYPSGLSFLKVLYSDGKNSLDGTSGLSQGFVTANIWGLYSDSRQSREAFFETILCEFNSSKFKELVDWIGEESLLITVEIVLCEVFSSARLFDRA